MRMRVGVAIALCGCILSGCGGSKHDRSEKIYLVTANKQVGYWQTAAAGFIRSARDMGVQGEVDGPDNYDPSAQHKAFQDVIGKKPTGILVSASDAKLLQPDIDAAVAQGIPVLTIDSDAPDSKRAFFIGTNNHQAGLIGGARAVQLTGGKANIVIYTMPGQTNLAERLHGYKDAFTDHPDMKIVRVVDIQGKATIAFDATTEIVTTGKLKADTFICLEAISCKEVADVMARQKVTGKTIIGMDTDPDLLNYIKNGAVAATIAQKPYTMTYFGARMLDMMFHDKALGNATGSFAALPAFVDTGSTLIDKTNVDEFIKAQESATK